MCFIMYTKQATRNGMYAFGLFYNLVLMFVKFSIIYRCKHRVYKYWTIESTSRPKNGIKKQRKKSYCSEKEK